MIELIPLLLDIGKSIADFLKDNNLDIAISSQLKKINEIVSELKVCLSSVQTAPAKEKLTIPERPCRRETLLHTDFNACHYKYNETIVPVSTPWSISNIKNRNNEVSQEFKGTNTSANKNLPSKEVVLYTLVDTILSKHFLQIVYFTLQARDLKNSTELYKLWSCFRTENNRVLIVKDGHALEISGNYEASKLHDLFCKMIGTIRRISNKTMRSCLLEEVDKFLTREMKKFLKDEVATLKYLVFNCNYHVTLPDDINTILLIMEKFLQNKNTAQYKTLYQSEILTQEAKECINDAINRLNAQNMQTKAAFNTVITTLQKLLENKQDPISKKLYHSSLMREAISSFDEFINKACKSPEESQLYDRLLSECSTVLVILKDILQKSMTTAREIQYVINPEGLILLLFQGIQKEKEKADKLKKYLISMVTSSSSRKNLYAREEGMKKLHEIDDSINCIYTMYLEFRCLQQKINLITILPSSAEEINKRKNLMLTKLHSLGRKVPTSNYESNKISPNTKVTLAFIWEIPELIMNELKKYDNPSTSANHGLWICWDLLFSMLKDNIENSNPEGYTLLEKRIESIEQILKPEIIENLRSAASGKERPICRLEEKVSKFEVQPQNPERLFVIIDEFLPSTSILTFQELINNTGLLPRSSTSFHKCAYKRDQSKLLDSASETYGPLSSKKRRYETEINAVDNQSTIVENSTVEKVSQPESSQEKTKALF